MVGNQPEGDSKYDDQVDPRSERETFITGSVREVDQPSTESRKKRFDNESDDDGGKIVWDDMYRRIGLVESTREDN